MDQTHPLWGKGRRHQITQEQADEANAHLARLAKKLGGVTTNTDDLTKPDMNIVKPRLAQEGWFDAVLDELYTMGVEYSSERDWKRNRNALRKAGISRVGKMRARLEGEPFKHSHPRSGSADSATSVVL